MSAALEQSSAEFGRPRGTAGEARHQLRIRQDELAAVLDDRDAARETVMTAQAMVSVAQEAFTEHSGVKARIIAFRAESVRAGTMVDLNTPLPRALAEAKKHAAEAADRLEQAQGVLATLTADLTAEEAKVAVATRAVDAAAVAVLVEEAEAMGAELRELQAREKASRVRLASLADLYVPHKSQFRDVDRLPVSEGVKMAIRHQGATDAFLGVSQALMEQKVARWRGYLIALKTDPDAQAPE